MKHSELISIYKIIGNALEGYNRNNNENYMWTLIDNTIKVYANKYEFDSSVVYFLMLLISPFDMVAKLDLDEEDKQVIIMR